MERAELKRFLAALGCAERHGGFTFLRDPHWSAAEQAAAETQMSAAAAMPEPDQGWLCIRTGGSGGAVKFARHDESTLAAAVQGFADYFNVSRINTVGILPPWHVSGLMARLRCFATGGTYLDADWKAVAAGARPALPRGATVLSVVPTQLQRLLNAAAAVKWLREFAVVFLGGGPTWPELADAAATAKVPAVMSYGMTETAAMVVSQRPAEFAAGDRSCGSVLPHARVRIDASGRVVVGGASLFRGYLTGSAHVAEFATQDLGRIGPDGRLHILGRADDMIITGGMKVSVAEIEAALRASGEFEDVAVVGVPDPEWGQTLVACYPASSGVPDLARATASLAPHQRPKRLVALAAWPRNAQGKINRAELVARVALLP